MIKAIIFDLGKVIIPFDFQRGYERMAPLCRYTAAEIPERLRGCDLVTLFEAGQVEPEVFVKELCSLLDLKVDYPQFCEIWGSIFLPDTLLPESLLAGLGERYRLLLLSNTNAIHYEMVKENYRLLRHFHHHVLSFQVGVLKPSPKIFQEAIRRSGCRPEECFFTDDISAYVEAARAEGIDAVQFHDREQIEGELRRRGVEW
jgi:FMN phosphatase YigB (HAD superfamily)